VRFRTANTSSTIHHHPPPHPSINDTITDHVVGRSLLEDDGEIEQKEQDYHTAPLTRPAGPIPRRRQASHQRRALAISPAA
jgi:hypothetical protein